jgi:pimeloyl-ACP methyl ester carboxylesterase
VLGAADRAAARARHGAIAVDLPCDDAEAGFDATADVAAAFLLEDDVVVAGHSLSGLVLPHVAARRPVRALVYLCAFVPLDGKSMGDQFRDSPEPIVTFPVPPEGDAEGRSYWPTSRSRAARSSPTSATRTRPGHTSGCGRRRRLGVASAELDAGHFPMLTAPDALADALSSVV